MWTHLDDEQHDWRDAPLVMRLQIMRVCIEGMLWDAEGEREAHQILALEGLAEVYGSLPYEGALLDQPHGLVEAYSVIRRVRNEEQIREMAEAEAKRARG